MLSSTQLAELSVLLNKGGIVTLTTHRNPDGDALGSTLAMKRFLEKTTKLHVELIVPDIFPDFLDWLPGGDSIRVYDEDVETCRRILQNSDLIFCLDYNHPSRVATMEADLRQAKGVKIMLDHHQQPDSFVNYVWSDTSASSTCELVFEFISALGKAAFIDKEIATCLYTGIMTDTGSFRFIGTTSETHRIAAELLAAGIEHWKIHEAIFNQNSLKKLQLWGYALSKKLTVVEAYKTAYIVMSAKELETFDYEEGDLEGLVNYALSIKGMLMGVLISERNAKIRISFRSIGNFSVNHFSRLYFNGGGHENAAGGSFDGSLGQTEAHLLTVLPQFFEQFVTQ
jgi:phosphoesterase RecJ-like protein